MALTAGYFNKRIHLQYEEEGGFDDEGYPIEGKKVKIPLWAMVKTVKAEEYTKAKSLQAENTIRFIIRYRKQFDGNYLYDKQILYKGQSYEIESVINDNEANTTLTIIGRSVSNVKSN